MQSYEKRLTFLPDALFFYIYLNLELEKHYFHLIIYQIQYQLSVAQQATLKEQ